jgi:glutathione peroxidase-family protein
VASDFADKQVNLLIFPSSDFYEHAEPGTNAQIEKFAGQFSDNFRLFAKSGVTKDCASPAAKSACSLGSSSCCAENDPVFRFLRQAAPLPAWNFDKWIIDAHGHVMQPHLSCEASRQFPAAQWAHETGCRSGVDAMVVELSGHLNAALALSAGAQE